jgi:hypothetical protein
MVSTSSNSINYYDQSSICPLMSLIPVYTINSLFILSSSAIIKSTISYMQLAFSELGEVQVSHGDTLTIISTLAIN